MLQRSILFSLSFLFSLFALAHPVSYKDAVGVMSYNNPKMNELLLTYSLNFDFAIAGTYLRDSNSEFYIPRADFLVKRWNNSDSQGNIYLSAGSGIEKFNGQISTTRLAEFVSDWESRKYYVYLEHLYLNRENKENPLLPARDYNHTKFRVGTAPFLAEYQDLNVWLILQAEKHNTEPNIELTQFLRFYIRNTLWEIGARFDGGWAFNYMIHF